MCICLDCGRLFLLITSGSLFYCRHCIGGTIKSPTQSDRCNCDCSQTLKRLKVMEANIAEARDLDKLRFEKIEADIAKLQKKSDDGGPKGSTAIPVIGPGWGQD